MSIQETALCSDLVLCLRDRAADLLAREDGDLEGQKDRLECPEPSPSGLRYRRIRYEEAHSLLVGLYEQGVEVEGLLAQIEAFPYQYIALDRLSQPAENAAWLVDAMEREAAQGGESDTDRLRHHRDFVSMFSRVIPPGAQLWLRGWLEAVAHGALARAIDDDEQAL